MAGRPKGSGKASIKIPTNSVSVNVSSVAPKYYEEDTISISEKDNGYKHSQIIEDEIDEVMLRPAQDELKHPTKDSHSEAIQNLRDTLDATGIEYLESDSITQLSIKLNKGIKDMGSTDLSKVESDASIKTWGGNTQITQISFLRRLKEMGVRPFWVRGIVNRKNPDAPMKFLFDDSHSKLPNREIHRIIRHSGVSHKDMSDTLRTVGRQPQIPLRYKGGMGGNVSTGTNW